MLVIPFNTSLAQNFLKLLSLKYKKKLNNQNIKGIVYTDNSHIHTTHSMNMERTLL